MRSVRCDYSLEHVASRPAKVGDKLATTRFKNPDTMFSPTVGFCGADEPNTAICLLPGTEIAFDQEIEVPGAFWMRRKMGAKVGRFRRVHENRPYMHHDALELPDGRTVMLTTLCEGQRATVLQLPVIAQGPRRVTRSGKSEIVTGLRTRQQP
jgi:hypothetical protein